MKRARPLIAVVDDEASVRSALGRLMRSAGMDVETFKSGAEFLDAMAARPADCVLLDLHMPDLNGFEVQARLVQLGRRLPVVVITGHDLPESGARALAGGAAAYLLKPVDDRVLLVAIADAISSHSG